MSTSKPVASRAKRRYDTEVVTQWGVELPDGVICEACNEEDAFAIVQAAKTVSPRAKYVVVNRSVTIKTSATDWEDVS